MSRPHETDPAPIPWRILGIGALVIAVVIGCAIDESRRAAEQRAIAERVEAENAAERAKQKDVEARQAAFASATKVESRAVPATPPTTLTPEKLAKLRKFVDDMNKSGKPHAAATFDGATLVLDEFLVPDCTIERLQEKYTGLFSSAYQSGFISLRCTGHNYRPGNQHPDVTLTYPLP